MLSGLPHFVHTAEHRSFREAARQLGISPAAVSKAVARLESELGVVLLHRTSRRVELTPEGARFLVHARAALDAVQAGLDEVAVSRDIAEGEVRISLSVVLGRPLVASLPRLLQRHPRLRPVLRFTDRAASLAADEVDIALRLGALPDSALVARRLRTPRQLTCASPALVARLGRPTRPADLDTAPGLGFVTPSGHDLPWRFRGRDGRVEERPVPPGVRLDDGEMLVEAAVAGLGVVQAPDVIVETAVAEGRLLRLLEDWTADGLPLHALCSPGRQRTPRVRAVLDHLVEVFGMPG